VFSAVVVNYNGERYLERCLTALRVQDTAPAEIVVVDNASTDASVALLEERFPDAVVVNMGGNFGPSVARNAGVAAASHDRCLVLDNDVILHEGTASRLFERLDREPGAGMVQPRSVCGDRPDVVHYDRADLHFLGTLVLHNFFRPLADATPADRPSGAAISLCFAIDRAVYRAAGGFDESMFFFFEDTQFSWKVRMRGHTIHLEDRALVTHLGGTAGLSMRSEKDAYPARRTELHSRNRWYVLLTCMRWRTLLLTLPAQLLYGFVFAVFAHLRGHGLAWWRSKFFLLADLPRILKARREAQRGRTVPDRALLVCDAMTVHPGLADSGWKAALRRSMDRFFAVWWRCVRGLCG